MQHRDVVTTPQGTQLRMILRFEDERGDGHCLARLVLRDPPLPPVAVFSAIRGNPRLRGVATNFDHAADALRAAVGDEADVPWDDVVWVAHYGEFSDWHIDDAPERFVLTELIRFNGHYHDDLDRHRTLRPAEFAAAHGDLGLEPVPDVVRALGGEF